jgi:hypothetical protein
MNRHEPSAPSASTAFHVSRIVCQSAIAALLTFSISGANGQTLSVVDANRYSATPLFSATSGFTITGMASDSAGNLYYIQSDSVNYTESSQLIRRSAADSYALPTVLFDYESAVFGAFVTLVNQTVYFGESTGGVIRQISASGGTSVVLATVPGIYDLAVTSGGTGYLSANPDGFTPGNRVYQMNLSSGAVDSVLNASPDYSGPVEIDALGRVIYGYTGFVVSSVPKGLYAYSEGDLAAGLGAGEVAIDGSHRVATVTPNAWLAPGAGNLLRQTGGSQLSLIDLSNGTMDPIASSTHSIGQLDGQNGTVFANVSRYSGTPLSTVYRVTPVPEPTAFLAIFGGLCVLSSVRRRSR